MSNDISTSKARVDELASRIRVCGNKKQLAEGKRLHAEVAVKHRNDRYLSNLLIEMYGKCESVALARSVFDEIKQPNPFSWSIMISAYAQNGHLQLARDLFKRMPEKNLVSWNALIAAYSQIGDLKQAKAMFDRMTQRDVVSWNALLAAYAQHGHVLQAREFFDRMPERDVVSWTSLLSAYSVAGELEELERIFRRMPTRNVVSWNALLAGYTQNGYLDSAQRLFDKMPTRNVVSWTTMMEAYAKSGQTSQVKEFFDRMPTKNIVAWTILLIAYARKGDMDRVREFLEQLPHKDVVLCTAMITSFARNGHLREASFIFRKMTHRNLTTWNSMLEALASSSDRHAETLDLLDRMIWEGIRPDDSTFVSALTACSHVGRVELSRDLFLSMVDDHGLRPKLEHYSCLINIFGRAGHLDRAEDLIRNMPFRPQPVLWLTLLAACKLHNDVDRASRIREEVSSLDGHHTSTYILMSNIYRAPTPAAPSPGQEFDTELLSARENLQPRESSSRLERFSVRARV